MRLYVIIFLFFSPFLFIEQYFKGVENEKYISQINSIPTINSIDTVEIYDINDDVGLYIANYLIDNGFSLENASAISGNIMVESKGNPLAVGDNGQSFGLSQWRDSRFADLKGFTNGDWKSVDKQLSFLIHELKGKEKRAYKKLKETMGLNKSVIVFCDYYHRPSIPHIERRIRKANEIYKVLITRL